LDDVILLNLLFHASGELFQFRIQQALRVFYSSQSWSMRFCGSATPFSVTGFPIADANRYWLITLDVVEISPDKIMSVTVNPCLACS
jgi:hypothetical protein